MIIFFALLVKLIPLYALILLGFLAGKFLKVQKESIATLSIYVISPVIFFNAAATTPITFGAIAFPFICFLLIMTITLVLYVIGKHLWKDGTANLFAYTGAMGNYGYFGLPVAIAVLPNEFVGPYLLGVLGMNIFDVSGAYYLVARGQHTVKESIKRVLMLPTLYIVFIGIVLQLIHTPFSAEYTNLITNFKGAYVVLGMMLVGLGIASMPSLSFDWKFLSLTFLAKFLLWPIVAFTLIFLDNNFFHFYSQGMHNVLILLSLVPVAANSVAYSTQFNLHPHKAALVVLLSTLFAVFYVPLIVILFVK